MDVTIWAEDTYRKLRELSRRKDLNNIIWNEEDCWVVDALYGSIWELKYRNTLTDYAREYPDGMQSIIDGACDRLVELDEPKRVDGHSVVSDYGLGLGTFGWKYDKEVVRTAIGHGVRFLDTAETYGYGRVEVALGELLCQKILPLLIATKVSRNHMSYNSVVNAAGRSATKLGLDKIGLYQIHWPNPKFPIDGTAGALKHLVESGVVDSVGICNCSVDQLMAYQNALWPVSVASVQVRYNLLDCRIERSLLPYCQSVGIPIIAYSPLGQKFSRMMKGDGGRVLTDIASRYGISEAQVALVWVMSWEGVIPIPRTNNPEHAVEIAEAISMQLYPADLELLDHTFPPAE